MGSSLARRLASFGGLPLLSILAPALLLPIVARSGSASTWAAFATGQAIGSIGSVLVMYGWSVTGQARVAQLTNWSDRSRLYWSSLASRSLLLVPVSIASASVSALMSPAARPLAACMAVAICANGLSSGWFSVGCGRASWIAIYEAGPRLLATGLAAALLIGGAPILVYPALLLLTTILSIAAFNRCVLGRFWSGVGSWTALSGAMKLDSTAAAVSGIGNVYANAPIPIANLAGDPGLAGMVSADRLYRYAAVAVATLGNALQAWVLSPRSDGTFRRKVAFRMHLALGLSGAVLIAITGPALTGWLFGNNLSSPEDLCFAYAVAFLALSLSTPIIRNFLVPEGHIRSVLVATALGGSAGLLLMLALGAHSGLVGVAFGFAVSEAVCLLSVVVAAAARRRGPE